MTYFQSILLAALLSSMATSFTPATRPFLAQAQIKYAVLETYVFKNAPHPTTEVEKIQASEVVDAALISLIDGTNPSLIFRIDGQTPDISLLPSLPSNYIGPSNLLRRSLGLHSLKALSRFIEKDCVRDLQAWPHQRAELKACDQQSLQNDMMELRQMGWDVPSPFTASEMKAMMEDASSMQKIAAEGFSEGVEETCKLLETKGVISKDEWKRDVVTFLEGIFYSDSKKGKKSKDASTSAVQVVDKKGKKAVVAVKKTAKSTPKAPSPKEAQVSFKQAESKSSEKRSPVKKSKATKAAVPQSEKKKAKKPNKSKPRKSV
jgi:hypothetical protein